MNTIRDVLNSKKSNLIISVKRTDTIRSALSLLCGKKVGALLVLDDKNAIEGIISERDLVRHYNAGSDPDKIMIFEAMSKDVLTVTPDNDIKVAMRMMCHARVRHLPVVSKSGIEGIVTIGDMIKTILDSDDSKLEDFLSRMAVSEAKRSGKS